MHAGNSNTECGKLGLIVSPTAHHNMQSMQETVTQSSPGKDSESIPAMSNKT